MPVSALLRNFALTKNAKPADCSNRFFKKHQQTLHTVFGKERPCHNRYQQ